MTVKALEELRLWKEAIEYAADIYSASLSINDFVFKDQIRRAALSVANNIAEGYGRETSKEFIRFLFISKGSNAEVQSMLCLGEDLGFLKPEITDKLKKQSIVIEKMLWGMIKYLKTKPNSKTPN